MAVNMVQARLWMPTEAAGRLLSLAKRQLCEGCGISVGGVPPTIGLYMALIREDFDILCPLTWAELVEADFGGYARVDLNGEALPGPYCLGVEGPSQDIDDVWTIYFDQQIFTATNDTTPNSIFGAAIIVDTPAELLLGVARFAQGPYPMAAADDKLKVSLTLPLECVVPELEDVPE